MRNRKRIYSIRIRVSYYGNAEIAIERQEVVNDKAWPGYWEREYFVDRAETLIRAQRIQKVLWSRGNT